MQHNFISEDIALFYTIIARLEALFDSSGDSKLSIFISSTYQT